MDKNAEFHAKMIMDISQACVLHDAQKLVAKAIFIDGVTRIFIEAGRKVGKTTLIPYCSYRMALSKPNAVIYICAPFYNQARELLWSDHRITHFLPKDIAEKYGVKLNNTELRVSFGNGSFIKLIGSDNAEAGRGVNPDMIIFDEGKDVNEDFYTGMEPNLAAKGGILMMVGTPPETEDNLFCKLADEIKRESLDGNISRYFNFPTWCNPHISKDWLRKQKQRLIDRGEEDKWLREYEAKRVQGGSNSIFPMFKRSRHVRKYDELLLEVKRHIKDWDLIYSFDPGSSSTFAGLMVIINKRTKKVIVLDEIYEERVGYMSTGSIYPIARQQMDNVNPFEDRWTEVYDNAAMWFASEVQFAFGKNLTPCEKDVKTKMDKLSMIKDMLNMDYIVFSDKCQKTIFEIENFVRDKNGKIDKCKDHGADCLRYALNAANYDFTPDMTIKVVDENKRFYTMEEDRRNDIDDVYQDMLSYLYE